MGEYFYWNYSLILGSRNDLIIINFIDDGTDDMEYKHINITILDVHFANM